MMRFVTFSLLCVATGLLSVSCRKTEATPEPAKQAVDAPEPTPTPAANDGADAAYAAKTMFQAKCVVCHGTSGAGDGPGAAALNPKPRAFTDPSWQTTVTNEQIESAILMGGAAVGKSPAMPGNPELQAKPEVVKELVKIVRAFQKG